MTVGTARPLRSLAICQISHLYHKISVCKEPVKPSGQNCRKFFALCPISGASAVIWENIVDWAWGRKTAAQHGSEYVRDIARIPGPAGVAGGKRRGRTKSGKGGRGFISPAGIFSSPHADRVLGSAGGRGALPRLLSPASRRVDSRAGRDGGAGSGRDGGSARCEKAGAARGAKKGTGGAGSPFPRWVASLPHIARIPGSAGMVGRERDAKRHEHRVWAAVCAGERTGWQGKKKRRCALASARMTGRGILPHVDRAPGSAGMVGRGKGEVRADPAECNSPRTVRAGRFALDPGGYLSSRAVSSQVLSAYEGLTAVFGMGTGGTPQLNHRKLPVP